MKRIWLAAAVSVAAGAAMAHHAMEFIGIESYTTARRGEKLAYLHHDYRVDDADRPRLDHWELTPGCSYGFTDWLMGDVHTHFARFGADHIVEERRAEFEPNGPSPFMEAAAFSLQGRLPERWPVQVALVAALELPFQRAEDLLGSDDPVYAGTLILNRSFGEHRALCANLGYEIEGDEDEWSWAVGVKTPISADPHGIAAGLELFGDFDGHRWSVLPGVYAPLNESVTLKAGIEIGQERDEDARWADTLRSHVSLMVKL